MKEPIQRWRFSCDTCEAMAYLVSIPSDPQQLPPEWTQDTVVKEIMHYCPKCRSNNHALTD